MLITNNLPTDLCIHYRADGYPFEVFIAPFATVDVREITDASQIVNRGNRLEPDFTAVPSL